MKTGAWLWLWRAVHRALAEVPHTKGCDREDMHHVGGDTWISGPCSCDRDIRQTDLMVTTMRATFPFNGKWSKATKERTLRALKLAPRLVGVDADVFVGAISEDQTK